MLESIDVHEPLLINSIGHSVGLLLFAGFLVLFLGDRHKHRSWQGLLPALAAALALAWNAGSLAVLAASSGLLPPTDQMASLSFAILSLLPAVLLHLTLEGRPRGICRAGYALSAAAAGLHLAELVRPDARFHQAGLWMIVLGFGILSAAAMWAARGCSVTRRPMGSRLLVGMCLFLFAVSFAHFSPGHPRAAWRSEIALHHAGIPLALYVLLQDYRFLMLDAFVRFLANSAGAAGVILLALALDARFHILRQAAGNPFLQGVLFAAACLALLGIVVVRGQLQWLLTRVVFGRHDREPVVRALRGAGARAASEAAFLEQAAPLVGGFFGATRTDFRRDAAPVDEPWVEVAAPLRFLKGDAARLRLGPREGGRRYLSEDLQELDRMAAVVVEQVERLRESEMHRLVADAELRALQSQINPHFLFNALNALYGSIPREAATARRMVLNLAEIFRYSLQSERTLIALSEELDIVRAYLEIEALRLGDRLRSEITVDPGAAEARIPVLSIQPLVENAVKHGVAARPGGGTVRLHAAAVPDGVRIEVSDDGAGFAAAPPAAPRAGGGLGLDNVRQRLTRCFGEQAALRIRSTPAGSTVSFLVPAARAVPSTEVVRA